MRIKRDASDSRSRIRSIFRRSKVGYGTPCGNDKPVRRWTIPSAGPSGMPLELTLRVIPSLASGPDLT
jgi:hypothetical protein